MQNNQIPNCHKSLENDLEFIHKQKQRMRVNYMLADLMGQHVGRAELQQALGIGQQILSENGEDW